MTTHENGRMASWNRENGRGFHFGIEAEYLLVDAETFRPLWHHDLTFEELNAALETIPFDDLPPLDGLELEPPHTKLMPFVVEGYHLPSPEMSPRDLLPKGIEIRTPVCPSIETCLESLRAAPRTDAGRPRRAGLSGGVDVPPSDRGPVRGAAEQAASRLLAMGHAGDGDLRARRERQPAGRAERAGSTSPICTPRSITTPRR